MDNLKLPREIGTRSAKLLFSLGVVVKFINSIPLAIPEVNILKKKLLATGLQWQILRVIKKKYADHYAGGLAQ